MRCRGDFSDRRIAESYVSQYSSRKQAMSLAGLIGIHLVYDIHDQFLN